jgi:hypothetical protein
MVAHPIDAHHVQFGDVLIGHAIGQHARDAVFLLGQFCFVYYIRELKIMAMLYISSVLHI